MPDRPTIAVLFDAMGTLVRLVEPAQALARQLGVDDAVARRAVAAEIAYYRAHHDEAVDERSLADLRARCAEAMRASLRADGHDVTADRALAALMASLRMPPYDDVKPTLRLLRERGLRLAVVSNWDVSLLAVLEREGIASLFDDVVTSASTATAKPDPAIFNAALARLDVDDPARAVHVGDSVDNDVAGALAAGMRAVLLARPGEADTAAPPPGVPVITSLSALVDYLGEA